MSSRVTFVTVLLIAALPGVANAETLNLGCSAPDRVRTSDNEILPAKYFDFKIVTPDGSVAPGNTPAAEMQLYSEKNFRYELFMSKCRMEPTLISCDAAGGENVRINRVNGTYFHGYYTSKGSVIKEKGTCYPSKEKGTNIKPMF
ncbi:MAG: hypothetical protein QM681_06205 [Novosphingobium sp.]